MAPRHQVISSPVLYPVLQQKNQETQALKSEEIPTFLLYRNMYMLYLLFLYKQEHLNACSWNEGKAAFWMDVPRTHNSSIKVRVVFVLPGNLKQLLSSAGAQQEAV